MRTSTPIPIRLLALSATLIVTLGACAQKPAPTSSPKPTPKAALSMLAVPFTFTVPVADAGAVRVAAVNGDWIDTLAPLAATQLTYRDASGQSHFLANAFWFDRAQLAEVTKPSEPPPGTTMATVGDRVLVVATTVEMPFEPNSKDGRTYGALSELARDATSYARFMCPSEADAVKRAVTPVVRDVVTAYFLGKDLLPLTIDGDQETVRDVQQQLSGTHACFNDAAGGEGAYVGSVPAGASEAVMVYAHHKPYPATQAASTFVTLAHVGGAWTIVAEGTSP